MRTNNLDSITDECGDARDQTCQLSPDEQLAFWQALSDLPTLTPAQKRLSDIMRGPM